MFSESNIQDVERTMKGEKDQYVGYYDEKYKSGNKKRIILPDGTEILQEQMPGIFEFYAALNKNKPNYIQSTKANETSAAAGEYNERMAEYEDATKIIYYYPVPLEDAEKNRPNILSYYARIRRETNPFPTEHNQNVTKTKINYLASRDFMRILSYSDMTNEQLIEYYDKFKPSDPQFASDFLDNYKFFLKEDGVRNVDHKKEAILAIRRMMPYFKQIGAENSIEKSLRKLSVKRYEVFPDQMVEFVDIEYFPSKIINKIQQYKQPYTLDTATDYEKPHLMHGRKYSVLEVRTANNIENAEILIMDDGYADPVTKNVLDLRQERWLPSAMYKIKKIEVVPKEDGTEEIFVIRRENFINENIVRNILRERIEMVSEKINSNKNPQNKDKYNTPKVKKPQIKRYTGIILDQPSIKILKKFIEDMQKAKRIYIPNEWEYSLDHVTINPGPPLDPSIMGQTCYVKVLTYAFDENIIALGIKADIDTEFEKDIPHITVAFSKGTSPVKSNDLTNWKPIAKSFVVQGTVKMIEEIIPG